MEIYTTLSRRKQPFTPHKIKEMYMSQVEEFTFMDAFNSWFKEVEADVNRTKATKKAYKNVRNKVLEFLISKKRQNDLLENFDLGKNALVATDTLNDRVLPFFQQHEIPLLRILTDRGTEYCGAREHHEYELYRVQFKLSLCSH